MEQMKTVLLVDDDPNILQVAGFAVTKAGYRVVTATDGKQALKLIRDEAPCLVVLDIVMPELDGMEVCRELRKESAVPVIFLTSMDDEIDRIVGLELGADDYLTKPFSPRELVARIKAALRRMMSEGEVRMGNVLQYRHVRIDTGSRQVWVDDRPVELTQTEFDLLAALAEHRGMVLSREQLLEKVWGYDYFGDLRVVDVHVGHLRQKLGNDQLVATVRGVGYRFEDQME